MVSLQEWIEKLYTIAINGEDEYDSDPQMASSLLSSVITILESNEVSHQEALKLAISYIHFESAHNSGLPFLRNLLTAVLQPHTTMGIVRLLRDAIETEVDNIDLDDYIVTLAESLILEYADIVLPWLWRASQNGIQSDFAQSMVIFFCIAESYGRRHYICSFSIARLKIWRESGVQSMM